MTGKLLGIAWCWKLCLGFLSKKVKTSRLKKGETNHWQLYNTKSNLCWDDKKLWWAWVGQHTCTYLCGVQSMEQLVHIHVHIHVHIYIPVYIYICVCVYNCLLEQWYMAYITSLRLIYLLDVLGRSALLRWRAPMRAKQLSIRGCWLTYIDTTGLVVSLFSVRLTWGITGQSNDKTWLRIIVY